MDKILFFKILAIIFTIFIKISKAENSNVESANSTGESKKDDTKIIGGQPISIKQAPWQVSVRLKARDSQSYGSGFICGGSVISQRVVVTAAHCVVKKQEPLEYRSPSEFSLVMGTANLLEVNEHTLQYNVLKVTAHGDYNPKTNVYDVALFLINGFIPQNHPTVAPIEINFYSVQNGTMCVTTGWGKTDNNAKAPSSVLMGAKLPIVSNQDCSASYASTISITDSMLCAGFLKTGGVSPCFGDSGGPLICNGLLTGITSFGKICAEPGYPGVFANVPYVAKWIIKTNSTYNYANYITDKASGFSGLNLFFVIIQSVLLILICKFILN